MKTTYFGGFMGDEQQPDDSIESIEVTPENIPAEISFLKNSTISSSISRGDDIFKMLSQVINLTGEKLIHEPTCQICSSPNRKEIEKKYLENKSISDAKKSFKDLTNVELDEVVFENHFYMHMTQGVRELQKVEYAQKIRRLYSQNLTTLDRISMSFAVIMERILAINSLIPSSDESIADIERTKSSETARLTGVLHNMLKLQASILGEMKTSGELITIPQKDFIDVFMDSLQDAKTEKERDTIKMILDKLEGIAKRTQI